LLRNIPDYSKVGVHVRSLIRDELLKHGMASKADDGKDLGEYYWDKVWVYLLVGPVARIIKGAGTPGQGSDDILSEAGGGTGDAEETLKKVKALICG
jgi:hypothetical protein